MRPDQSYKKKAQEQLIDLEEAFMENRYQFEAESPPVQPTVEQKRVVESPVKRKFMITQPLTLQLCRSLSLSQTH